MKPILLAFLALSLFGCGGTREYPPESPYYAYPKGAVLRLNRAVDIPPESATLRFQYGRIVARDGVREEDPHCVLEVDSVETEARRIAPDTPRVTDIRRRIQTFAGMPAWTPRHAYEHESLRRLARRVGSRDDGGPSHVYYITEFRLRSEKQPGIRALTCLHNQMMPGVSMMRHLTLPEIRGALGEYFTLELRP